jgi:hypothetical protein
LVVVVVVLEVAAQPQVCPQQQGGVLHVIVMERGHKREPGSPSREGGRKLTMLTMLL